MNILKKYLTKYSSQKYSEIKHLVEDDNHEVPKVFIFFFNVFYDKYILPKKVIVQEKTDLFYPKINTYKDIITNTVLKDDYRVNKFTEDLKNNTLKQLFFKDGLFLSLTFLDLKDDRYKEVANLLKTMYDVSKHFGIKYLKHNIDSTKFINTTSLNYLIYTGDFKRQLGDISDKGDALLEKFNEEGKSFTIGGVSLSSNSHSYSVCGTNDELHKLFFHEHLHYAMCDTDELHRGKIKWDKGLSNRTEAFTEMLSIVLHAISMVAKIKYIDEDIDVNKILAKIIEVEKVWSICIVAKILKLYGYTRNNCTDFFKENNKVSYDKINIYGYYFCKSILLWNIYDVANYLNDDLSVKDGYNIFEDDILNNLKEGYIAMLSKCMDCDMTSPIGYICLELNDIDKIKDLIIEEDTHILPEDIGVAILKENKEQRGGSREGGKKYRLKKKLT